MLIVLCEGGYGGGVGRRELGAGLHILFGHVILNHVDAVPDGLLLGSLLELGLLGGGLRHSVHAEVKEGFGGLLGRLRGLLGLECVYSESLGLLLLWWI